MAKEKKYEVYTPNRGYHGTRRGVLFSSGVGHATKKQAKLLIELGYYCPEIDAEKNKPEWWDEQETGSGKQEEGITLPSENATNDQLRSFMDEQKITYETDDNKPDLQKKIADWHTAQKEANQETTGK